MPQDDWEHYKQYQVQADSVKDFLRRYYKQERITNMLSSYPDYFEIMLESYTKELLARGFCFISHHDNITGRIVAYYGGE